MSSAQRDPPRKSCARKDCSSAGWAAIGLGIVVALGCYFRFINQAPLSVDLWWQGIATVAPGSAAFSVAVFTAQVGAPVMVVCTVFVAALLWAIRKKKDAWAVAATMLLGVMASEMLKALVIRPRPEAQLYLSQGHSFPSGHSMGGAALAISLALVLSDSGTLSRRLSRAVWVAVIAWIVVMMWSRTALNIHWLSDTLAGALLGACVAVLVRQCCRQR